MQILSAWDKGHTANYHVWRVKSLNFYEHNNASSYPTGNYTICKVIEKIGGLVTLVPTRQSCSSATPLSAGATIVHLLANPSITFPTVDAGDSAANQANTIVYAADEASVEQSTFNEGSVILQSRTGVCNTPFAKYMKLDGKYYKHDLRLKLSENTQSDPVTSPTSVNFINTTSNHQQETGRFARCPDVPMNPFNRGSCRRSTACLPLLFDTTMFTLDASNLKKFYTISGKYVYYITGLRLEASYAVSPCTGTSRWKKLSGACASNGGETGVDAGTKLAMVFAIDNTTDTINPYVRDVHVTGTCNANNGGVSSIAAKIEVDGTCWEHVHPELFNVYDLSYFSTNHGGNGNFIKSNNPIERWAKAGGVEIQYPASHTMTRWASIDGWMQPKFPKLGRFGEIVDFRLIPADVQTKEAQPQPQPQPVSNVDHSLIPHMEGNGRLPERHHYTTCGATGFMWISRRGGE
jgi:hypothetical protein